MINRPAITAHCLSAKETAGIGMESVLLSVLRGHVRIG
jgi:hypothetical protein